MKERADKLLQPEKLRRTALILLTISIGVGSLTAFINSNVCSVIRTNPPYTFDISVIECALPNNIDVLIIRDDQSIFISADLSHRNPNVHRSDLTFEFRNIFSY